jgi:hypothetical protein
MSDKIAVYIISMGETPQAVHTFISAFSARFKISPERMLALSKKLPAKIGSYDPEKAKQFGIEIRRMGGEVSLRRFVAQESVPVSATAAGEPADSWVVHGHAESQDELRSMTAADTVAPDASAPANEYSGVFDDVGRGDMPAPPAKRTIGKFEAKQAYTADQGFGLNEERFKKVKDLYAARKAKTSVIGSPAFRILLLVLTLAAGLLVYVYRDEIRTLTFGLKEVVLSDAYENRLPASVSVPADLTGSYTGRLSYTTRAGDSALVDVSLFIEGKNVRDIVVAISSTLADIGPYRLNVEYAPGYVAYTKTIKNEIAYTVENTYPTSTNSVGRIDERGRFSVELEAIDTGVDPNAIPRTEKDHLGNMIFLKIEGAFAGDDKFYGGLLTSGSPLMGWEAGKK